MSSPKQNVDAITKVNDFVVQPVVERANNVYESFANIANAKASESYIPFKCPYSYAADTYTFRDVMAVKSVENIGLLYENATLMIFDGKIKRVFQLDQQSVNLKFFEIYNNVVKWHALPDQKCMLLFTNFKVPVKMFSDKKCSATALCHCCVENCRDFMLLCGTNSLVHENFCVTVDLKCRTSIKKSDKCKCVFVVRDGDRIKGGDLCALSLNQDRLLVLDKTNPMANMRTLNFSGISDCKCCNSYNAKFWNCQVPYDDDREDDHDSDREDDYDSEDDDIVVPVANYVSNLESFEKFSEQLYHAPGFLHQNPVYLRQLNVYLCVGTSAMHPECEEIYVLDFRYANLAVWSKLTNFAQKGIVRQIVPSSTLIVNFHFDDERGWVCKDVIDLNIYLRFPLPESITNAYKYGKSSATNV